MRRVELALASGLLLVGATGGCGKKEEPVTETSTPAAGAAATPFDPATGTATIGGKVTLENTAPAQAQIRMNADPHCVAMQKGPVLAQEVVTEGSNLLNVFVYVKEGLEKHTFTPPTEPAVIDQQGCRYHPHVGGIMVNQPLKIVNSDATMHNIHCWAEKNPQFNTGQPMKGQVTEKTFTNSEVMVRFKCDVHKWMSAYMGVLPHPYFRVTGSDGAFSLKSLPPGHYVIEAWHEKFGIQTQKVTVGDKESKEINFSFQGS